MKPTVIIATRHTAAVIKTLLGFQQSEDWGGAERDVKTRGWSVVSQTSPLSRHDKPETISQRSTD